MDTYENYLGNSFTNLHYQKTMLEYICNEMKLSCRRLVTHNTNKEMFEREKALLCEYKEGPVGVDLKEVDDLISKAQQLLQGNLSKPMKQSSQRSTQKKTEEKNENKSNLNKNPHLSAKASKRSTDPPFRQKKVYASNKISQPTSQPPVKQTNIKKEPIPETLKKETFKSYNFVSFKEDFLSVYRESKKCSNAFQTASKKYKPDAVKCQKQFLDALANVDVDKKPCYIEKFAFTEKIFAKFKPCEDLDFNFSSLKDWFVYQIELEIENQRLEFLTLYSKFLRDCLMRNEIGIKDYRLIYWQLSRTLPVLVTDEKL